MIKRVLWICFTVAALKITGKMISNYAETKPTLKSVKDKLKKTGQDFSDDCKEVGLAIKQAFVKEKTKPAAQVWWGCIIQVS